MVDGDADFVAVDDSADRPPILFKAADVAELQPHWDPIARIRGKPQPKLSTPLKKCNPQPQEYYPCSDPEVLPMF
jgi:hypothetical protein